MKFTEGWIIFIAGVIVTLFIFMPAQEWIMPIIKEKWLSTEQPKPELYVFLFEQNIFPTSGINYNITPHYFKYPERVEIFPGYVNTPIQFDKFPDYNMSSNEKFFEITIENRGNSIAKEAKIDIDFTPNLIDYLKTSNEKVKILQGGIYGSRVVFSVTELFPNEIQNVRIILNGDNIKSINAWSSDEGDVKNIYYVNLDFKTITS